MFSRGRVGIATAITTLTGHSGAYHAGIHTCRIYGVASYRGHVNRCVNSSGGDLAGAATGYMAKTVWKSNLFVVVPQAMGIGPSHVILLDHTHAYSVRRRSNHSQELSTFC